MPDPNLKSLDPKTGAAPTTRVLDAASLNAVVKSIIDADAGSALARQDHQAMVDGAPPFPENWIKETGQEGKCNLNFGDGKAAVKAEMAGYYDLTDSVPTIALVMTDFGDNATRPFYNAVISEEFHRLLKDWKGFDSTFQLLVQKFCTHGLGFLYFKDDLDWRWEVAGLEDFKIPRATKLNEDEMDVAIALREFTVGQLYGLIRDVPDDDKRWNKKAVREAILYAADNQLTTFTDGAWEKWGQILKNNDLFATATAQETVHVVHVWVREFSGKVSQYLTLRNARNTEFLFKCQNRFKCPNECFTFFPYEVPSNGLAHAIRGKAAEIYATVQVLNTLRGNLVDNSRLAGSLLLQPTTEADQQDLAIMFYAGAAYIPPGVKVQNTALGNPSAGILPVIRDMTLLMQHNAGDTAARSADNTNEKTKYERQSDDAKESVLPTASMNLFYQPWGRHLSEVWRRVSSKELKKDSPGGDMAFEMRKRIIARGVPLEAIYGATQVIPFRAIGYGSPTARLMALDEFMQFYGSLDPVGQNNLLRDRFAMKTGYAMVDRYVPQLDQTGRAPLDQEVAELQNVAMSAGTKMSVITNDHHIIHILTHLPSLTDDLDLLESGQGTPQLLGSAQLKGQHIADHQVYLKPDKLNEKIVAEIARQANNALERVKAATTHAQRAAAQQAQQDQQDLQAMRTGVNPSPEAMQKAADGDLRRQQMVQDHELKQRLEISEHTQKMAMKDAENARTVNSNAAREQSQGGQPLAAAPTPPEVPPLATPGAPIVPTNPPAELPA